MVAALTFHSADDKFARLGLGKKKFWRGRTPNANRRHAERYGSVQESRINSNQQIRRRNECEALFQRKFSDQRNRTGHHAGIAGTKVRIIFQSRTKLKNIFKAERFQFVHQR